MEVSPEYAQHEYRRKIDAHIEALRDQSEARRHGLLPDEHSRPLDEGLREYLSHPPGEDVMGFLAPWFLAGVAAVGLPVWLHLLQASTGPRRCRSAR